MPWMLATVPMDVAERALFEVHAEERVKLGSDIHAAESELQPRVRYDASWRAGQDHVVAMVQPRLIYTHSWNRTLPDPNLVNPDSLNLADPNDTPTSVLHGGSFGYEMARRRVRLSLYQFASYGPVSTTALLAQAPWKGVGQPPDPNPILPSTLGARFTLLFAQTQVAAPIKVSPRTLVTPALTYGAYGGADRVSRGVVALSQGPGASLTFERALTRRDRVSTTVGAGRIETKFEDQRQSVIVIRSEATQSWRHAHSRKLFSEVTGGASLGGSQATGYTLFSLAKAALLYDSYGEVPEGHGRRVQFGVALKAEPWLDLFSGELEQRMVASAATNISFDRFTIRGGASHARVFGTPRSVAKYEILLGETSVEVRWAPTVSVHLGLRVGQQRFENAVRDSDLRQASGFFGLSWTPLPARL